ncbi:MAG: hypothetical protein ACOC1K_08225 [Nanoarchaeota archaeon]
MDTIKRINIVEGIFNINIKLVLEEQDEDLDDYYGYYDSEAKEIAINLFFIKDVNNPEKEIENTIIHELGHLFDYNC